MPRFSAAEMSTMQCISVLSAKDNLFLTMYPTTETVLDIKEKLLAITDYPVEDQQLILPETIEVENDVVVALALRKEKRELLSIIHSYMAAVLAIYRQTLMERTKHHLGEKCSQMEFFTHQKNHTSNFKAAGMFIMDCVKINTLVSGEIDCSDFKSKLLPNKDKPAILNVNIGTTVKGVVDDFDLVIQTLEECGYSHDRFYIHCDGALLGLMMPFVKRAPKVSCKKAISL